MTTYRYMTSTSTEASKWLYHGMIELDINRMLIEVERISTSKGILDCMVANYGRCQEEIGHAKGIGISSVNGLLK